MTLYLSLSAYGGVSTRQALTTIAAAGIQSVELAIGVKPDADAMVAIQEFQAQGMSFRAHHALVWGASHYPFNLAKTVDRDYLQRMVSWLNRMGITAYSVHPGSYDPVDRAGAWCCFLDNLSWLRQSCQTHGISFAVETMYPISDQPRQRYFLDDLESIRQLCEAMPELLWVLDLSHLNIWPRQRFEQRIQVIELLHDRLLEIHVSDNDGLHDIHTTITDQTWWLPLRERLPRSVPYVLESRLNRRSALVLQTEYQRVQAYLSQEMDAWVKGM
jgi:sugar phosphate isomerase/epimerase